MGWRGGYTKHLHIVINDPNKHGGHAVVVNATKNETLSGGELIVTNTDHPWLDYDKSWIAFTKAMKFDKDQQERIQRAYGPYIVPETAASEALVQKIVAAALVSKYFPKAWHSLLR
jgi:hypothetical protein